MPEHESRETIWKKIRRLNLPRNTKECLRHLWYQAKVLVQAIVNWLYQRRQFCSAVMLGVALAYLVHPFPIVGPTLASLSVSMSVLYGIVLQVRADLDRHFSFIIEGAAV